MFYTIFWLLLVYVMIKSITCEDCSKCKHINTNCLRNKKCPHDPTNKELLKEDKRNYPPYTN